MTDYRCKREMTFEEELLAFDARLKELLFAEDEYPGDSLLKSVLRDSKRILSKATAKIEALQMDKEQLESDVINANMNCEHLQAENKRLLTEFLRLKEENAQPYLLINADAELTAEMIETIKKQKLVILPDNEATVEFLDKASIRAEAVKEFAEKVKGSLWDMPSMCDEDGEYDYVCMESLEEFIDNLVKEMAGEEK